MIKKLGDKEVKRNIEELTLLLMYLTSWDEDGYRKNQNGQIEEAKMKSCWKGYDFDAINDLIDKNYLYFSKYTNKSVTLTPEGEEFAKRLIEKYI